MVQSVVSGIIPAALLNSSVSKTGLEVSLIGFVGGSGEESTLKSSGGSPEGSSGGGLTVDNNLVSNEWSGSIVSSTSQGLGWEGHLLSSVALVQGLLVSGGKQSGGQVHISGRTR